ncbi:MAG: hypothetical protein HY402_07245 [Elusimicrobia bacterium]|nr:hypothetical protein [Elusimicrobiota bacterium]
MSYEIRSIPIKSLIVSVVPAVLFFLGLFGGIVTFFLVPNPQLGGLGPSVRLMATGLFALLYMALMNALLVVAAFLYNLFVNSIGLRGIRVEMESEET